MPAQRKNLPGKLSSNSEQHAVRQQILTKQNRQQALRQDRELEDLLRRAAMLQQHQELALPGVRRARKRRKRAA